MRVLRLRQSLTAGGGGSWPSTTTPAMARAVYTSKVPLLFELNEHDRSRLRFYLENFLTCPNPAALKPVADLRDDLRRWGEELFRQVFKTDRKALFHYEEAARDLHPLRIEILADHPDAWMVPWELLYDPNLGWLAPQVRSFARLPSRGLPARARDPPSSPVPGDPLRVLYVVGRPAGSLEIPFHSVARAAAPDRRGAGGPAADRHPPAAHLRAPGQGPERGGGGRTGRTMCSTSTATACSPTARRTSRASWTPASCRRGTG